MYKTTLKEIKESIKWGSMLSLKEYKAWAEQRQSMGYRFYTRQLAYSCGYCGCTGQVHEIMLYVADLSQYVVVGKVGLIGSEIYML